MVRALAATGAYGRVHVIARDAREAAALEATLAALTGADAGARARIDVVGGQHAQSVEGADTPSAAIEAADAATPNAPLDAATPNVLVPSMARPGIDASAILGGAALAAALFGEPDEEIDLTDLQEF